MPTWVTVAVFQFAAEISVLKLRLEHLGIPFFFENEHLISVDPFASLAYGGIRLKVHHADADQVRQLLDNEFSAYPDWRILR